MYPWNMCLLLFMLVLLQAFKSSIPCSTSAHLQSFGGTISEYLPLFITHVKFHVLHLKTAIEKLFWPLFLSVYFKKNT